MPLLKTSQALYNNLISFGKMLVNGQQHLLRMKLSTEISSYNSKLVI